MGWISLWKRTLWWEWSSSGCRKRFVKTVAFNSSSTAAFRTQKSQDHVNTVSHINAPHEGKPSSLSSGIYLPNWDKTCFGLTGFGGSTPQPFLVQTEHDGLPCNFVQSFRFLSGWIALWSPYSSLEQPSGYLILCNPSWITFKTLGPNLSCFADMLLVTSNQCHFSVTVWWSCK